MTTRRLLAATLAGVALLSSAADARGVKALDGVKRTKTTYEGTLTDAAAGTGTVMFRAPSVDDCTDQSCDVTQLRLTLPKGSIEGKFTVTVRVPRELNLTVGLYNAKGGEVELADMTSPGSTATSCCDPLETAYHVVLKIFRLPAGKYTLVMYDHGGIGTFRSTVEYTAHPPSRPKPAKR